MAWRRLLGSNLKGDLLDIRGGGALSETYEGVEKRDGLVKKENVRDHRENAAEKAEECFFDQVKAGEDRKRQTKESQIAKEGVRPSWVPDTHSIDPGNKAKATRAH